MYNSIDFFYKNLQTDEEYSFKNTWEDWGLVGSSRPTIAPAKPITNLVKVTGMSGFYNASEVLTGYPLYESRTGSFEFIVLNSWNKPDAKSWVEVYSEVSSFLNGQELCCTFEDDPEYFYKGVFAVNEFASGEYNSTITIDYEVEPYKYRRNRSDHDWEWDTFNFETGIIPENTFRDWHIINDEGEVYDLTGKVGDMPVVPEIVFSDWTTDNVGTSSIEFTSTMVNPVSRKSVTRTQILKRTDMYLDPLDTTKGFYSTWKLPLIVMYDNCIGFAASVKQTEGTSDITFSIRFREGRL